MKAFLRTVFLQPEARHLRSGWRLLLFFALIFLASIPFTLLLRQALETEDLLAYGLFLGEGVSALVITIAAYLATRWLDKRPFASLGLRLDRRVLRDLAAGIGITFLMMGGIFLAEWAFGWLQLDGFAWQRASWGEVLAQTAAALAFFLLVAWAEELLTRGYLLQTLADGLGLRWAVIVSSAFFGLAHLGNPNATWVSAAGIFFAGLFLAYGYTATRQLWLPIGLHWGWNFFEGVVFGFPVSGMSDFPTLLHIRTGGPTLWTGGAFGPEAGLIVLPALALGAWLIRRYAARREEDAA